MGFAIYKKTRRVLVFLLLLLVVLNLMQVHASSQVPCFYIFGDSLVDSGNNNNLDTKGKVNYRPYGIDFPQGPTGRFTNGRTTADFLAELLGFENFIPPFATAQGNDIITGVNYGSGYAGIRDETGSQVGDRISLNRQLQNHNLTISRVAQLIGNNTSAAEHLQKCLYLFVIGSNDYINNYYSPEFYPTSQTFTTDQYASILIQQYSQQLKTLYNYGARKIAVSGLGPLGCIPFELKRRRDRNISPCVNSINYAVKLFNDKLKLLVDDLNKNVTDAKFAYISSMTGRPTEVFGLAGLVVGKPCCKVNEMGLCVRGQVPCLARDLHVFYDDIHPSEILNRAVATGAYVEITKLIP